MRELGLNFVGTPIAAKGARSATASPQVPMPAPASC